MFFARWHSSRISAPSKALHSTICCSLAFSTFAAPSALRDEQRVRAEEDALLETKLFQRNARLEVLEVVKFDLATANVIDITLCIRHQISANTEPQRASATWSQFSRIIPDAGRPLPCGQRRRHAVRRWGRVVRHSSKKCKEAAVVRLLQYPCGNSLAPA
jgi:hypothetical protein